MTTISAQDIKNKISQLYRSAQLQKAAADNNHKNLGYLQKQADDLLSNPYLKAALLAALLGGGGGALMSFLSEDDSEKALKKILLMALLGAGAGAGGRFLLDQVSGGGSNDFLSQPIPNAMAQLGYVPLDDNKTLFQWLLGLGAPALATGYNIRKYQQDKENFAPVTNLLKTLALSGPDKVISDKTLSSNVMSSLKDKGMKGAIISLVESNASVLNEKNLTKTIDSTIKLLQNELRTTKPDSDNYNKIQEKIKGLEDLKGKTPDADVIDRAKKQLLESLQHIQDDKNIHDKSLSRLVKALSGGIPTEKIHDDKKLSVGLKVNLFGKPFGGVKDFSSPNLLRQASQWALKLLGQKPEAPPISAVEEQFWRASKAAPSEATASMTRKFIEDMKPNLAGKVVNFAALPALSSVLGYAMGNLIDYARTPSREGIVIR